MVYFAIAGRFSRPGVAGRVVHAEDSVLRILVVRIGNRRDVYRK